METNSTLCLAYNRNTEADDGKGNSGADSENLSGGHGRDRRN